MRDALEKKPLRHVPVISPKLQKGSSLIWLHRTISNKSVTELSSRGIHLFKSIYDPHTEKLLKKLGSYHPDFPGSVFPSVYLTHHRAAHTMHPFRLHSSARVRCPPCGPCPVALARPGRTDAYFCCRSCLPPCRRGCRTTIDQPCLWPAKSTRF